MVKATMPELQFSAGTSGALSLQQLRTQFLYGKKFVILISCSHPTEKHQIMNLSKKISGAPKSNYCAIVTERGMAYGTRVLWSRSSDSSPMAGKPSTWRSGAGCYYILISGGARDA